MLGGRKGGMPEMVFEFILKKNNIDPAADLSIDQSIDFGSTAAAFTGNDADFTVVYAEKYTAFKSDKILFFLCLQAIFEASDYFSIHALSNSVTVFAPTI